MYLKYLCYIIKHKWYVAIECFKVGLYWRGIVHDMDKFLPCVFIPYARHFFSDGRDIRYGRDQYGHYDPTNTGDEAFDFAIMLHLKRNRHHWQWWVIPKDYDGIKILEMDDISRREMYCDWIGAGKAQGRISYFGNNLDVIRRWWLDNNKTMQLHPNTRTYFDKITTGGIFN